MNLTLSVGPEQLVGFSQLALVPPLTTVPDAQPIRPAARAFPPTPANWIGPHQPQGHAMSHPLDTPPEPGVRQEHQLRRGTLGTFGIAFFVISAAAPLTAMAGGAPVAMLLGNGPGIPLAYVVVSVILVIFAVGYTTMARHHTSTGAFYSFVARGLRQPAGGAAALIALLGYNAMQIGLYGLFSAAASGFFSDNLGIDIPWWVFSFV